MSKTSSSCRVLLLAGVLAAAGAAQAEYTFDVPTQAGEASTMTGGAPNRTTSNVPYTYYGQSRSSTATMGAAPAVVYDSYAYPSSVYILPAPVTTQRSDPYSRSSASETSNVPERAGEASNMTRGAPNLLTTN